VVTGPSVAWTFDDLYYLERAAMVQVLAQGTGKLLKRVPHAVAAPTVRTMCDDRTQSDLHFAALRRLADRDDPGWAAD